MEDSTRKFLRFWNEYVRGYLSLKQGHEGMKKLLEDGCFNQELLPLDVQKMVVKANPKGILMIALERLGRVAREDEELLREYKLPKIEKVKMDEEVEDG